VAENSVKAGSPAPAGSKRSESLEGPEASRTIDGVMAGAVVVVIAPRTILPRCRGGWNTHRSLAYAPSAGLFGQAVNARKTMDCRSLAPRHGDAGIEQLDDAQPNATRAQPRGRIAVGEIACGLLEHQVMSRAGSKLTTRILRVLSRTSKPSKN
jgi:hypothetical protein